MAVEKIRRKDKYVYVNMQVVGELLGLQREKNCSLRPRKDGKICSSCSKYPYCLKHKWERDYCNKRKDAQVTSKRRKSRQKTNETEEKNYICDPFDFCCPRREECDGEHCLYYID